MVEKQEELGRTIPVPANLPSRAYLRFHRLCSHHLKEGSKMENVELYNKMGRMIRIHGFLKRCYEDKLPYTEEFEQMCDIGKEELDKELRPFALGKVFESLKDYHKAAQHESDSIYRKNARILRPMPQQEPTIIAVKDLLPEEQATFQKITNQEKMKFLAETADEEIRRANNPHFDFLVEVRDVTWGERAEGQTEPNT